MKPSLFDSADQSAISVSSLLNPLLSPGRNNPGPSRRQFLAAGLVTVSAALSGCSQSALVEEDDPDPKEPSQPKERLPDPAAKSGKSAPPGPLHALALSRDGKVLAAAGKGNHIQAWSVPDGKSLATLTGARDAVIHALALSPDGKTLACATGKTIALHSLPDGKLLHTFAGHVEEVRSLAFASDKVLVSGALDGFIKLWSLSKRTLVRTLPNLYSAVNALGVTPDGKLLVSGSGFLKGELNLWSLPEGKSVKTLRGLERSVTTLAVAADGALLASGAEGKVRLWSLPQGQGLEKGIDNGGPINDMAFLPGNKLLACASEDQTIKLWSVPEGKLHQTLKGHRGRVVAVAVLPGEDESLLSADSKGTILMWDLASGEKRPFRS